MCSPFVISLQQSYYHAPYSTIPDPLTPAAIWQHPLHTIHHVAKYVLSDILVVDESIAAMNVAVFSGDLKRVSIYAAMETVETCCHCMHRTEVITCPPRVHRPQRRGKHPSANHRPMY